MYTVERAGGSGAERRERADRTSPGDEHPVARGDARALDPVRRDRGRLDQRSLRVADAVGERDNLVFGDGCDLGHPTPGVG